MLAPSFAVSTAHCQRSPSVSPSPEASWPCTAVTAVSVQSQVSVGFALSRHLALCTARDALAAGGAVARDQGAL